MTTKKALIAGGGIAGTVAAMALQRAGWEPAVYEAHASAADNTGAFLTLAANGLAALDAIGMRDQVTELGMSTPRLTMVSARNGRELGSMDLHARTVDRTELYLTLRDEAVARGIPVHYGRRLIDARTTADGVHTSFASGDTVTGDILIGADGLRSRVRSIIDPAAPSAEHIGLLNTGGYAHGIRPPGEPGTAYMIFGRRCFFGYFIHPDAGPGPRVWWFANPPSRAEQSRADLAAISSQQWRQRLTTLFQDDTGPMLDIIAATPVIFPAWTTYDLPRVKRWHSDRMVLIGDSVHATSPSSGQGASMAIEDAVMLAICVRDLPDPAAAFSSFTSRRRQRVEKVVQHGRRSGSGKAAGPLAARARDLLLPLILRKLANSNALDWMYDYRIDWNTPAGEIPA